MVRCLLALLVCAAVISAPWNDPRFITVRDGINNNPASTWKAAIHTNIPYDNEESLRRLCGSKMDATLLRQNAIKEEVVASGSNSDNQDAAGQARRLQSLPTNFDLRQAFPKCWSISNVRNQANCGSCWAVSSLSSLSDRQCVKTGEQKSFSYQDATECCSAGTCGTGPNKGCQGGYIHGGFAFAQTNGVVTGENFLNYTTCKPYSFNPAGGYGNAVAPSCNQACANSLIYKKNYYADKTYIRGYNYITGTSTADIVNKAKQTIMKNGSIVVGVDIYSDFYYYSSGVYQRNGFGSYYMGGHAMAVIGWGVENGAFYWLVRNSWGSFWGMGGYIKFKGGENHCRIESFMVEGVMN